MTAINRDQIETLIELQKIETERRATEVVLSEIAQRISGLEGEVQTVVDHVEKGRAELEELRNHNRELEVKIQENAALIAKIEEKRRSVQTEREYRSLLKEEDQLRALKNQMEEEMISCMGRMETIEADLAEKETELTSVSQRVEEDKETINREASESEQRHAALTSRWREVADQALPQLLKTFTRLKDLLPSGDAVVPARASVCCGCNMNIPAQMYNEIQRSDSLKLCPYCNRILYYENDRG